MHGEFDPVANGQVFGLTHAPDVARVDIMLEKYITILADNTNFASGRNFKRLVVRAVLFGFLRHQTDVAAPHLKSFKRWATLPWPSPTGW